MSINEFHALLRRYISPIMIGGAALSVAFAPNGLVLYVMFFWAAFGVALAVDAHLRTRKTIKRFPGDLIAFVYAPTPMGSLLEALQTNGIRSERIAEIRLMSADVDESLRYYEEGHSNGSPPFLEAMKSCPDVKVTIYGRCNSKRSTYKGIKIVPTKDRFVEHTNLITTKDDEEYVWFEPYHNVINQKHYFTHGAYLFRVSHQEADKVRRMLDSLPLSQAAATSVKNKQEAVAS
jgi:hypothetical protein